MQLASDKRMAPLQQGIISQRSAGAQQTPKPAQLGDTNITTVEETSNGATQPEEPVEDASVTEYDSWKENFERLEKKIAALEQKVLDIKQPPPFELDDLEEQALKEIANALPTIDLPKNVTVEQMLEWAKGMGLSLEKVKAAFGLFGNFSQSDEGDNWLAKNTEDNKESYLFPSAGRFESSSHYNSAYREYYTCEHPSAGRILIERPAIVSYDGAQGGWKVINKGVLSVAS